MDVTGMRRCRGVTDSLDNLDSSSSGKPEFNVSRQARHDHPRSPIGTSEHGTIPNTIARQVFVNKTSNPPNSPMLANPMARKDSVGWLAGLPAPV